MPDHEIHAPDAAPKKNGGSITLSSGFIALMVMVLNLVIVLVNLIASSGYTSKGDFNALKETFWSYREKTETDMSAIREKQTSELGKIANGITELNDKMKENDRQDQQLADHEKRLRDMKDEVNAIQRERPRR